MTVPRLSTLALLAVLALAIYGTHDPDGATNVLWQLRNSLATLIGR